MLTAWSGGWIESRRNAAGRPVLTAWSGRRIEAVEIRLAAAPDGRVWPAPPMPLELLRVQLCDPITNSGSSVKPVIVAGHVCVDLTPTLDAPPVIEPGRLVQVGPLSMSAGGCVGNTGLALAALGVPAQLVANVGSDRLGDALLAMLAGAGLGVDGIRGLAGRGTSYSVVMDVPGRDRTIWHHIGANESFRGDGVIERLREAGPGAILHLGYPTHLPGLYGDDGRGLIELVGRARRAGAIVSIDMAEIDPASAAQSVDWRTLLGRILPKVDVLKASVDDLASCLPAARLPGSGSEERSSSSRLKTREPIEWADELIGLGASVALVTAGADGLYLRTAPEVRLGVEWSNRELWVPPVAERVLATTGAGDTAAGGFIAGLADGRGPEDCVALSAAAAAARIAGRPIADAWQLGAGPAIPGRLLTRPGWTRGRHHVFHGPRGG